MDKGQLEEAQMAFLAKLVVTWHVMTCGCDSCELIKEGSIDLLRIEMDMLPPGVWSYLRNWASVRVSGQLDQPDVGQDPRRN